MARVFILLFLVTLCLSPGSAQEGTPAPGNSSAPTGPRVGGTAPNAYVAGSPRLPDEWGTDYQIQILGGIPMARTQFLAFCRDLRKRFRWTVFRYRPGEISRRDEWVIPLRVEIWGNPGDVHKGNSARMGVELRPGDRFEIWVAARLHDEFVAEEFRLEFVRALITERMIEPYITSPSLLDDRILECPEWLVHGFDELLMHRREGRPSEGYSGVLKSGQILSPSEIFSLRNPGSLDPVDYTIFRMSSAAMVETLLDQPDGDAGLREFIGELAMVDSIEPLLKKHFPAFREMEDGIEKWWVLQVATLGQQSRFEFLSRVETETRLNEALMIRFEKGEVIPPGESDSPGKPGLFDRIKGGAKPAIVEEDFEGSIADYREFVGKTGFELKLAQCFARLQSLKQVGFPLYRPLLDRYAIVLEKLVKQQTRGLDEELAELQKMRDTIGATLVRAEDILNHYEATRVPHRSDAFDEYRRARDILGKKGGIRLDDPISRYLDAYERGELPAAP